MRSPEQKERRRLIKIANQVYPEVGNCIRKRRERNDQIDRWMLLMTTLFKGKSEEWKEEQFKKLEEEFVNKVEIV